MGFGDYVHSFFNGTGSLASTKPYRKGQRLALAVGLLGAGIEPMAPQARIPTKFIQTLTSLYIVFQPDVKGKERSIHLFLGLLSAAQLGLEIYKLYEDEDCMDDNGALCTTDELFNSIYNAMVAVATLPAEFSKEKNNDDKTPLPLTTDDTENPLHLPELSKRDKNEDISDTEHSPAPRN